MLRIRFALAAFFEFFRFIKHYRERSQARLDLQIQREREEREHQFALLDTLFTRMVDMQKASQEGILALAKAQSEQANVLQTWLKGFQISDPSPAPPQVVREEDEWLDEQKRLYASGDPSAYADLPPEFRMAFAMNKLEALNQATLEAEGFDREGSDFK